MVSSNSNQPRSPGTIEARDNLLRAIEQLRAIGGEVRITVGGQPIGRFVPEHVPGDSAAVEEAIEFITRFGESHTAGPSNGWRVLRDEGRR